MLQTPNTIENETRQWLTIIRINVANDVIRVYIVKCTFSKA